MATSLLRLVRMSPLKCLQLESWGVLRGHPAVLFCSQAEDATRSTTKKAASKTAGAQDERATLLAYKTAVAFPLKFCHPEVSSAQSLGVAEPGSSSIAEAAAAQEPVTDAGEQAVAVPQTEDTPDTSIYPAPDPDVAQVVSDTSTPVGDTSPAAETLVSSISEGAVPPTNATSEPHDPAADGSSSSSSSSDSDSDSDSDEEKSEAKPQTKTPLPKMADSAMKEKTNAPKFTSDLKYGTNKVNKDTPVFAAEAVQESPSPPPVAATSTAKAAQATVETPSDSPEELVDSAPVICTAAEDTLEVTIITTVAAVKPAHDNASPIVPSAHKETSPEVVAGVASSEKNTSHNPISTGPDSAQVSLEAAESAPVEAAVSAPVEAAEAAPVETADGVPVETATKPLGVESASAEAAAGSTPMKSTEELLDSAPVIAEGAGADSQADTTLEEAAAAAPPEPEEPFDNSTYKNYQHHSYTPFTFVDLDVEMAKFRLPQPSSGKPSPRH